MYLFLVVKEIAKHMGKIIFSYNIDYDGNITVKGRKNP